MYFRWYHRNQDMTQLHTDTEYDTYENITTAKQKRYLILAALECKSTEHITRNCASNVIELQDQENQT